jgi:hypothetical protein
LHFYDGILVSKAELDNDQPSDQSRPNTRPDDSLATSIHIYARDPVDSYMAVTYSGDYDVINGSNGSTVNCVTLSISV